VRDGFRALAEAEPGRWLVLDASQSAEVVADAAWKELSARL
jgi:thymidylate kinase